jgi:hypothetical protein
MTIWTWTLAVVVASTGAAAAQPAPAPAADEPPAPPPPPAPAPPPPAHDEPRLDPARPSELAFGIGVGYAFPTSLQTPNTASVRVRLPSGLAFEPRLVIAASSADVATGGVNTQTELTVGALARYPLRVHRKVDLELVASAALSRRVIDPPNDNNNRTVATIDLGYGLAVAYWFTQHWNLSLTASNPLLSFIRDRQERGPGAESIDRTTTLGIVFDPQITLMIHLYD